MNKFLTLMIALTCMIIANSTHAQSFEGKITMKMEALNLAPEMEAMKSMFESNITTYTKGDFSRTEMHNPMTGNMFIITDMKKKEVVTCMDMMGHKTAIVASMDEYKEQQNGNGMEKPEFINTNETKLVAGHKCYKSIMKMKHENENFEMEFWCAKDMVNTNAQFAEMPGMPLDYSINAKEFTMHFYATEISKEKVDDSMFQVPADYTRTTNAEVQKKMTGGKGK